MQIHLPGHVPKFKQENQTWTVCHTVQKRTSGPFTSSNIHTCTKPGKKVYLLRIDLSQTKNKNKTKNKKEIDNLYICFVILFLFCQEKKHMGNNNNNGRSFFCFFFFLSFFVWEPKSITTHQKALLSFSLFDLLFLLCFFCLLLSYKETILQGRNCYHQYLIRLSNWRIVQTKLKKEIFVYLWIYGTTHQLYYSATQVPHQPPPTFYFFCFFSENCRWVLAYDPFACWENMGK